MNYAQAQQIYEGSRKRKLANNTYLEKNDDGSFAIRLHATQIIKFYPEKTVLNSNGYRTVTTKARLNEFTEFSVWQVAGIWYIAIRVVSAPEVVFADNISYDNKTGKWVGQGENVQQIGKLRKQAQQYAKDFTTALFTGHVPKPSNGDCWYCCLVAQDGRTLGEHTDGGHVIGHMDEKYYVPSLLVNAIKAFPISRAAEDCIAQLWNGNIPASLFVAIGKQQIESSIRRYCYRQLQTAS